MARTRRIFQRWGWPFIRTACIQILVQGGLLAAHRAELYPERWVATMLGLLLSPGELQAFGIMLVGVFGLVLSFVAESFGKAPLKVFRPSAQSPTTKPTKPWNIPSPWGALKWGAGRLSASGKWLYRTALYVIPGLDYEVAYPVPTVIAREAAELNSSLTFFWMRFGNAFPGLRETKEFTNVSDIAHRMAILLCDPLMSGNPDQPHCPLWWVRGTEDFYVQRWFRLKPKVFLLNHKELRVKRILAVPGSVYWQCFVYVECDPMKGSGLNKDYYTPERLKHMVDDRTYASEAFALYGFRPHKIEEADDGSFERRGRIRRFKHSPERRERFLTRYNFLIVPHAHPLMAFNRQDGLDKRMDGCLVGTHTPEELIEWALRLPRNREIEDAEQGLGRHR